MKIFILLFLSACTFINWKTYTDDTNHFKINYPENWSKQQRVGAIGFLSPKEEKGDMFQENVGLMLQDLSEQPMTLEQYTSLTKKQVVDNFGASAILSSNNITLGGQKAMEFVYNMHLQGKNLKVKQYWLIKGNLAYLFTYTAEQSKYEKYENTATDMIKSFKFF